MKSTIFSVLLPFFLVSQSVSAAEPLRLSDVSGLIQQWQPDATTITVTGRTFEISPDTVVMDGASIPIKRTALKAGARVMLMVANNKVTHVILDPIQASPFDRPNQ